MSDWFHKKTVAVESWVNRQREKLYGERRYLYFIFVAFAVVGANALGNFVSDFIKSLPWGWIVKIVIIAIPILFFLWWEITTAKLKGFKISWTGWVIAACLLLDIGWLHFKHGVAALPASNNQPAITSSSGTQAQIQPAIILDNLGESPKLYIGQKLKAPFANFSVFVRDISSGQPMALLNVSVPNSGTVQIQPLLDDEQSRFFTNYFEGKCYVAQLTKVGADDDPRWITIRIDEEGGNPQPTAIINSPSLKIGSGGSGTQTIDYSSKTFNGGSIEENRGVVNNYYITQYVTQTVIQVNQFIAQSPISSDAKRVGELMLVSLTSLSHLDFTNAYDNASEAIHIVEQSNIVFSDNASTDALVKGIIYRTAASSLDAMETNPQLAYDLAKKAVSYNKDELGLSIEAITAHNLATNIGLKDHLKGLKLEREAINIYESDPAWLNAPYMPSNAIAKWYSNGAWFAANVGLFNEAEIYANKAFDLNPSEKQLELLSSILNQLGYQIINRIRQYLCL